MMNETRLRKNGLFRRPSPAMVVAMIALAALVGTAVGAKLWGYSRAGSPNLILDPGFERKTQKDWRVGNRGEELFAPLSGADGHEVTRITTDASRGTACAQISGTGGDYLYQRVYLPLGDYRINYWRKTINHVSDTGAGLSIAPETGVYHGDGQWLYPNLGTTPWMQVPAVTITVTEAGEFGFFFVSHDLRRGGTGSGTVRFDRVKVEAM
jgi:hypothetical protein